MKVKDAINNTGKYHCT